MSLDRPIFVIGAARSGTTFLADVLGRHPDVSYWVEPKYIWRYRGASSESDVRTADEATPAVARYIQDRFEARTRRDGRLRFVEKTPSNCLRIPFIDRVFPEGLFLNLARDGRDTALSAVKKWTQPPSRSALRRRATSFEIPLRDAPSYAVDFVRDVVGRQFRPAKGFIWGPHIPGLREVRAAHTVLETCAIQWRECVLAMFDGLAEIPPERQLTVRYEDLASAPAEQLARILQFLDLRFDQALADHAVEVASTDSVGRWRREDPRSMSALEPLIAPAMAALGYGSPSRR